MLIPERIEAVGELWVEVAASVVVVSAGGRSVVRVRLNPAARVWMVRAGVVRVDLGAEDDLTAGVDGEDEPARARSL